MIASRKTLVAHPSDRLADGDVGDVDIVLLLEHLREFPRGQLWIVREFTEDRDVAIFEIPGWLVTTIRA